jgi:hypothetical protein
VCACVCVRARVCSRAQSTVSLLRGVAGTHTRTHTNTPCQCRPALAKGFMQLHSFEQMKSQPLEAHAAAFASVKVCVCVYVRVHARVHGFVLVCVCVCACVCVCV